MRRDRMRVAWGPRRGAAALVLLASLCGGEAARAQQQLPGNALPNPRLATLVPPGAKAGTSVEVTFTGTDLDEPQTLLFSHPSIKAEPVVAPAPPPPAKPADPKKPAPMPPPKPPVAKFKVVLGADVPPGIHDVRLVNKYGVSNPRAFVVGDLPEAVEKEPNNDVAEAQRIELNSTVSGAIQTPPDVDYYVFAGKKGQRVVLSCLASSIDSRLHPALEVYDTRGQRLGFNRRYNNNDALLDVTLPQDGDYYARLFEFTHTQGSAEHFYRLTVSTAPWVDAVFPPVAEPGKATQVTVYGRNLPGGVADPSAVVDGRVLEKITATVAAPADPRAPDRLAFSGHLPPLVSAQSGFEYRVRNAAGVSNPFLITYARAPLVLEAEPNDKPEAPQKVPVPCEIAGRVDRRNDRDWYAFAAKKGDVLAIEVLSDRLGAPTDMKLVVRNPATKSDLVEVDDAPAPPNDAAGLKFFVRTEDPAVYRFTAPADGDYLLLVVSQTASVLSGPRQFYRVRIAPEHPDFRLVVMPGDHIRPDSGNLLQGGHESFTVLAWRQDGFAGDVTLTAEGLPKGVTCAPQTLAGNQRVTSLVVSAAADAPAWTGTFTVRGSATVKGKAVTHEARPGGITWAVQPGQNIPTVSRLDRSLALAVRDKAPFALTTSLDKPALAQGDKATLALKLARLWPDFKQPLQVVLMDPIPNIQFNNNQPMPLAQGKDDATFPVVVSAGAAPGTYNLVLRATAQVAYNKDPTAKQKPNVNVVQASAPLTITILPKTVATVALTLPNPNLKVGARADVVIKVARQYDYAGDFKVQLVLPPNLTGVTADEVVIPAGKDEAKLVLKAAADAAPGPRNGLVVRATALVNGKVPIVQEAKFNVNVVK